MTYGIQFPPDERGERLLDEDYRNFTLIELVDHPLMPQVFSHRGLRYAYDQGYMATQPSQDHLYFVQWSIAADGTSRPKIAIFGNTIPEPVTSDYGLSIRNAANDIIYDSRIPFLKVNSHKLGPGLADLNWSTYTTADVSGLLTGANTFMLGNPFFHPFFNQESGGKLYIQSLDFIYSPPAINSFDAITLRMKKTSREYTSSPVVGYVRGFQYVNAYPIILADLDNLI